MLPSPWDVAAVPLDNHTLDVRWKAPAGDFSGFVVEWYAARNEESTVDTHWQRINASPTSLLITGERRPSAPFPSGRAQRFDPERSVKDVSVFQRECSRCSAMSCLSALCTAREGPGSAGRPPTTRGREVSDEAPPRAYFAGAKNMKQSEEEKEHRPSSEVE